MCMQEGPLLSSFSALPTCGRGLWDQTVLTSSKTSLWTVRLVAGGDADAFVVGKHLKGPVTLACVCPSRAPPPLLFHSVYLMQEGTCVSPFSPPCSWLGRMGLLRCSHQSCSAARGQEGCLS